MAHFLRDEQFSNLTLDRAALSQLFDVLASRMTLMPEMLEESGEDEAKAFINVTIRFDQKGYRVSDKEAFLNYFDSATQVERTVFEVVSMGALRSNRGTGSYIDLRLDTDESVPCFLTVSSNEEDWVNGSFSAVREWLRQCRNRNAFIRNPWTDLIVQLFGIFLGFIVSLWGASLVAPKLTIENPFLISFLLVLLLFSNLWGVLKLRLQIFVVHVFPTIRFYRPDRDRLHWLLQTLVGGIVVAVTLYS